MSAPWRAQRPRTSAHPGTGYGRYAGGNCSCQPSWFPLVPALAATQDGCRFSPGASSATLRPYDLLWILRPAQPGPAPAEAGMSSGGPRLDIRAAVPARRRLP